MTFRFEPSWTTVTRSLAVMPAGSSPSPVAVSARSLTVPAGRAPIPLKVRQGPRAPSTKQDGQREWELVLPKMSRPAPAVAGTTVSDVPLTAPHFEIGEEAPWIRIWSSVPSWGRAAAAVLTISAGLGIGWKALSPAVSDPAASGGIERGEGGWVTDWASDTAGSRRGRQITLYRPSIGLSNYRMDFTGRIEQKSLGWVFRAADTRNYHVMKLEVVKQGTFPSVKLTRFPVINGVEGLHVERMLPIMVRDDTSYPVRLEASGPRFAVSIHGQVVDVWADDRLKAGGVGFLNEREERGKAHSIRIVFPQGPSKGS